MDIAPGQRRIVHVVFEERVPETSSSALWVGAHRFEQRRIIVPDGITARHLLFASEVEVVSGARFRLEHALFSAPR